jgi:hypothetical protein
MSNKAFITKSNFNSIISSLYEVKKDKQVDDKDLYKWPVYFLSSAEAQRLLNQREFLKDPESAIKVYKKKDIVDNKKYIYEGLQPAYHTRTDCKNLQSKFKNYEIPDEIKEKGDIEIQKFRKWFRDNQKYLEEKPDLFAAKLQIAFKLTNLPKAVDHNNSGTTEINNLNLKQLEDRIDTILRAAASFYKDNPDKQEILKRFQKLTFLGRKSEEIKDNNTCLSDSELKSFLNEYERDFKKPFKDLLLQYYMVMYNPDLKFDGLLLEQLGFKICNNCSELDRNDNQM